MSQRPECYSCDCTFTTGCKAERLDAAGQPEKRPYKITTPRPKRGPYKLAKKRSAEREQQRLIKTTIQEKI